MGLGGTTAQASGDAWGLWGHEGQAKGGQPTWERQVPAVVAAALALERPQALLCGAIGL